METKRNSETASAWMSGITPAVPEEGGVRAREPISRGHDRRDGESIFGGYAGPERRAGNERRTAR